MLERHGNRFAQAPARVGGETAQRRQDLHVSFGEQPTQADDPAEGEEFVGGVVGALSGP
jgi:hypothetical protein